MISISGARRVGDKTVNCQIIDDLTRAEIERLQNALGVDV